MRIPRKAIGVALAVVATLALAGCVQPSPHVIPTSEPSSAPIFKSDADALAAAKKAYLAYLAVSDEVLVDGGKNPARMLNVVSPEELKIETPGFSEFMTKGWHSTGGTQIARLKLQGYYPASRTGIVVVYACIDVSKVDVVDSAGRSVVSPSRPTKQEFQTTFDTRSRNSKDLILASEIPWKGKSLC